MRDHDATTCKSIRQARISISNSTLPVYHTTTNSFTTSGIIATSPSALAGTMSSLIDKAKNVVSSHKKSDGSLPKVLFVLSSHDQMGDTGKPTGWYLPEFAHPYYKLEGKAEIVIASPKGGAAPLDPSSVEMFKSDEESTKFLKEKEALWKNTQKLSDFVGKANTFDAVFYVGGHGPMFDLATDPVSHQLIKEFYESGKVVSAVCHGPAAFVNVKLSDGSWLVQGQEVTGFTNTEEDQVQLSAAMPFMLETELEAHGGKVVKAEPWQPKVVKSGKSNKLITGQNPASASPIGEAILAAL
ncbi:unnamed protein product [Cercospora beticola]|nr:unnamed protein product [Cercospora beticola]